MRTHFIIIIQCIVIIYVISAWCALNLYVEQYHPRTIQSDVHWAVLLTSIFNWSNQSMKINRNWIKGFDFDCIDLILILIFSIEMVMRSRSSSVVWRSLYSKAKIVWRSLYSKAKSLYLLYSLYRSFGIVYRSAGDWFEYVLNCWRLLQFEIGLIKCQTKQSNYAYKILDDNAHAGVEPTLLSIDYWPMLLNWY